MDPYLPLSSAGDLLTLQTQPPLQGLLRELGRRLAPPAGTSLLAGAHYLLALLFPLSGVALFCFPHVSAGFLLQAVSAALW